MSTSSRVCGEACPPCDLPAVNERLIDATEIRLSEIISALSVALDITQGQPEGHCMRNALIGMRLADELQLATSDCSALYYALLLKDLGCSSNAAKMTYLFGTDDHQVKRAGKVVDWTKNGPKFKYAWDQCAVGGSTLDKLLRLAAMARGGEAGARKIVEVRCERGADIARQLRFPETTAEAILVLDEHWDGRGHPRGLKGQEIPLLGRICCLAQTVEIFHSTYGLESALEMARQRRGAWFDPQLVDALLSFAGEQTFWRRLHCDDLMSELSGWEPKDSVLLADEACLDRVAAAFARIVDAKSPWTFQHSTRVSEIAVGVSQQFGCAPEVQRDIRRAGLLHDIGKLGVSNLILDKPGKPTADEFVEIRKHPDWSQQILERVPAFRKLADVASAHHERLDGHGYHRRLDQTSLPWIARVLAVSDVYEALSAKRPYREALPESRIEEIMSRDSGPGFDPDCLAAFRRWHDGNTLASRVDAQMQEVDRLLAEIRT